jgi:diguanylate cyclase (GGDEF)-like protein/PAS domain S-box-containing protein
MDPAAFREYADACPDAVILTDPQARILHVNPVFERLTGYAREEAVGRSPALLKSGAHEADFYRSLYAALSAGSEFKAMFVNRRKNGEQYFEDKIIRPLFDSDGRIAYYASFGRDATLRARELDKLTHAATHDSLTDLPNRGLFLDRLAQALRHATRRKEEFTVAIMDLDRFRDTNNRFGHAGGDAVLNAVGARTRGCLRDEDTVARIGGDEFALVLIGSGGEAAARVLGKVVAANAVAVPFEHGAIPASVSIGACCFPRDAASEQELLKGADRAMYAAKHGGGNGYCFCSAASASRSRSNSFDLSKKP